MWQETKEAAAKKTTELWSKFAENSKEWESANKVFGHTQKSNPHRPKSLLGVDKGTMVAGKKDGQGGQGGGEEEEEEVVVVGNHGSGAAPFSSRAWEVRASIERAHMALLGMDEQRRLMQRPDTSPLLTAQVSQDLNLHFQALQVRPSSSNERRTQCRCVGAAENCALVTSPTSPTSFVFSWPS